MSTYDKMDNEQILTAVRDIVKTSSSEEEVRQRVVTELGYHHSFDITSHLPQDEVGRQAQMLVRGLGGLTMKSGAMVKIMMCGKRRKVLSL